MGITATGKKVVAKGILIEKIDGGKIIDDWEIIDTLGMLTQLGALPSAGAKK